MNQDIVDNHLNLLHYWNLVRGKLWQVVGLAVVVTTLAFVIVGTIPPVYKSTTTILLQPEQARAVSMEDLFYVNSRGYTYFNTQQKIIQSRKMIEKLIDELNMDVSPELPAAETDKKSWFQSTFKLGKEEPLSAEKKRQILVQQMKSNVEVVSIRYSNLMEISFQATSAEMAAKTANLLAQVYIRDSLEARIDMTRQATSWMRERTDSLKQQLARSEARLQQFIESEGLVDLGEGVASLTSQELSELSNRALSARARVSELRQRYGPKHPKLIAARSELAQAERAMRSGKSEIRSLGRKGVKLKELQHEVESTRNLYETFLNRVKETDESSTLKTATARIIDPAVVPLAPIKPNKKGIILAAFILTLAAGIGLIFLLDMLDSTIRSVEQVESKLGLPLLGLLPLLKFSQKDMSREQTLREMVGGDHNQFSESIRTIRTGIMLSAIDNPHKTILVTSSVPGEGKSTVSTNLAIAMGKMEKVLLIDADMRRPTVKKHIGMETTDMGLSELIAGSAEFKDTILHNSEFGIDIMHAGITPPNPLELISSKRFTAVMHTLEKSYDRIIIDSTPVQAVSDSLVLSQHAKGLVFVIKSDSTSEHVVKSCMKRLKEVNAPVIGVVLNQLDVNKPGHYGYGGYYDQYGYSSSEKA